VGASVSPRCLRSDGGHGCGLTTKRNGPARPPH
jgi:hypothetical protein